MSERTAIHHPSGPPDAPPKTDLAPAAPRDVEVYERAPTLMGGESPGPHGAVRVWGPARSSVVRITLTSACLMLPCCIIAFIRSSDRSAPGLMILIGVVAGLLTTILAFRTAPRIASDGQGLAFSLKRKRQYAAWSEVRSIHLSDGNDLHLYLRGSHSVVLPLRLYTKATRMEIVDAICSGAKLQPNPVRPGWFVRLPELPPAFEVVVAPERAGDDARLIELHRLPDAQTYSLVCRGSGGKVQEEQFFRTRTEAMKHAQEQYGIPPASWRRLRSD